LLLVKYKKLREEKGHFHEKFQFFRNFSPLGTSQDMKYFQKLLDFS